MELFLLFMSFMVKILLIGANVQLCTGGKAGKEEISP